MKARIKELAAHSALIIDEGDREYVLGLQMLMEMQEPIDPTCADKVARIYAQTMQNAFLM
jgi:hypothetical protein